LLNSSINNSASFWQQSLIYVSALLLFSVGIVLPVEAVDVPTLFSAQVPLDEEAENPREDAYRAALIQILARVSGSQLSENEEAIDEMFPVPAAYVMQFRPGEEDTLWVTFDGEAVERVLRASGQTVWGRDRPLTLVWLAVDWGQGEREIIAAGDPDRTTREFRSIDRNRLLRERVLEIADKRGLPLVFPLLDTTDLQGITFSDIWGGFDWTGPPEAVVAQVADLLAAEFAVGGDAPLEMVALNVSGVQTVDAYGSLQETLAGVSLIESFNIAEVNGDVVSYQIEVRGGADRLRRALRFAGLLEQTDSTDFSGLEPVSALEFFFNP
jgi:hypothetical protein